MISENIENFRTRRNFAFWRYTTVVVWQKNNFGFELVTDLTGNQNKIFMIFLNESIEWNFRISFFGIVKTVMYFILHITYHEKKIMSDFAGKFSMRSLYETRVFSWTYFINVLSKINIYTRGIVQNTYRKIK